MPKSEEIYSLTFVFKLEFLRLFAYAFDNNITCSIWLNIITTTIFNKYIYRKSANRYSRHRVSLQAHIAAGPGSHLDDRQKRRLPRDRCAETSTPPICRTSGPFPATSDPPPTPPRARASTARSRTRTASRSTTSRRDESLCAWRRPCPDLIIINVDGEKWKKSKSIVQNSSHCVHQKFSTHNYYYYCYYFTRQCRWLTTTTAVTCLPDFWHSSLYIITKIIWSIMIHRMFTGSSYIYTTEHSLCTRITFAHNITTNDNHLAAGDATRSYV